MTSISNLNRWSSSIGLFCHVLLKRDQRDRAWRLRFIDTPNTIVCTWSVISWVTHFNRWSSSPGLFYHGPLKRDQGDWCWRLGWNDTPNAISCVCWFPLWRVGVRCYSLLHLEWHLIVISKPNLIGLISSECCSHEWVTNGWVMDGSWLIPHPFLTHWSHFIGMRWNERWATHSLQRTATHCNTLQQWVCCSSLISSQNVAKET